MSVQAKKLGFQDRGHSSVQHNFQTTNDAICGRNAVEHSQDETTRAEKY